PGKRPPIISLSVYAASRTEWILWLSRGFAGATAVSSSASARANSVSQSERRPECGRVRIDEVDFRPMLSIMPKVFPHIRRSLALILSVVVLVAAGISSLAGQEWSVTIEPLSSPSLGVSAEPQLTTQDGRTILSWIERDGARATVKFAERTSSGWSEARVVVSGTNLFVNADDVPSVRALADGTLMAHWLREA